MYGYVFFATGKSKHFHWKARLITALVRGITLSPFCHCAIGFNGVLMNSALSGINYWPLDVAVDKYPTLDVVFRVPLSYAIDLDYFCHLHGVRQPILPKLGRFVDCGRGPWIYDCVCTTLACLGAGGIPVPRTIISPGGLHRWLRREGYPHVSRRNTKDFRSAVRHLVIP